MKLNHFLMAHFHRNLDFNFSDCFRQPSVWAVCQILEQVSLCTTDIIGSFDSEMEFALPPSDYCLKALRNSQCKHCEETIWKWKHEGGVGPVWLALSRIPGGMSPVSHLGPCEPCQLLGTLPSVGLCLSLSLQGNCCCFVWLQESFFPHPELES